MTIASLVFDISTVFPERITFNPNSAKFTLLSSQNMD